MHSSLWYVLKKEIREMFRDKKSLSMMLIIPFLIPLLVIGMSALFEMQMNKSIEEYNKIGFAYSLSTEEKNILTSMNIDYVEKSFSQLEEEYQAGEIDLYVSLEGNVYTMHGTDNDTTSFASRLVESYFTVYKEYLQQQYLLEQNVDPSAVTQIIQLESEIQEQDNYFANYMTNYAFLFIIMAITVSATYPATDATAGEKERGTLETLLTFPIKSKDIILGKFLSVSFSSIITGLISLVLMIVSLLLAGNMYTIYEGQSLMLSLPSLFFSILVIFLYSFLISGLCIAIASKSKTFKEAQSALTPLTFLSFFPGMIAFMVSVKTTTWLSLIPFLNYTLLYTDILNGVVNFLNLFLMILSTILFIAIVLFLIIKQYKSEQVLF